MSGGEERPSPKGHVRPAHLWVLWGAATLLGVSVVIHWGWRRGWWSARAELEKRPAVAYRVDLNRADEAELALLPGIGEVKAARIVAYRNGHGAFTRLEDLLAVAGISRAMLDRLKPYVVAGPEVTEGEEPSPNGTSSSR